MSAKKTFSGWLTSKYLFIIRNEENFAEKHTYTFNYARLILIGLLVFLIVLALAIFLVRGVLEQWLDPRYSQRETKRQLVEMSLGLDSLNAEIQTRDVYLENIKTILTGDFSANQMDSLTERTDRPDVVLQEELVPIDSQFRAEYEEENFSEFNFETRGNNDEMRSMYMFSPMDGIISDGFTPKDDHYGIDIVGKENEPVKAVADGVVVLASWTLDGGHVIVIQHTAGLVSLYKHNSELLKNVGNFVKGGDIVAIVGNSGELTNGPHLHFELWHNGNPVNPEAYIGF